MKLLVWYRIVKRFLAGPSEAETGRKHSSRISIARARGIRGILD